MGDCYGAGGWGRDSGVVACRRDVEIWLLGKGGECAGSFCSGFCVCGTLGDWEGYFAGEVENSRDILKVNEYMVEFMMVGKKIIQRIAVLVFNNSCC